MEAVGGSGELGGDTNVGFFHADAAFEDRAGAEVAGDGTDVVGIFELKGGGAGDNLYMGNAGECVDDFLGEAFAEGLLRVVGGHIKKRQDDDGTVEWVRRGVRLGGRLGVGATRGKARLIASFGERDRNFVVGARLFVVRAKHVAEAAGFDTDNGIGAGTEALLIKDEFGDVASGGGVSVEQGVFDENAEEAAHSAGTAEGGRG